MADEIKNDENSGGDTPADTLTQIAKVGGVTTKNKSESIHCLSIIGQVEGHFVLDSTQKTTKYEHILPLLCAVEENSRQSLEITVHSVFHCHCMAQQIFTQQTFAFPPSCQLLSSSLEKQTTAFNILFCL